MMLLERIKKERMTAIKDGDTMTKSILSVLVGDIETINKRGKLMSDADIIALIKKYLQSNQEMMSSKGMSPDLLREKIILESYLPIQMSEYAIEEKIRESGLDNIGAIMQYMKSKYAGMYDGKTAKQVADKILKK